MQRCVKGSTSLPMVFFHPSPPSSEKENKKVNFFKGKWDKIGYGAVGNCGSYCPLVHYTLGFFGKMTMVMIRPWCIA